MKLDSQIRERLQRCSKDEVAQAKLEALFSQILAKYEEVKAQLGMLEKAISHDYDAILITDLGLEEPGPKIVYVNDGFTRMTGYTKEEIIGKTPRVLQGPKTERSVLDRLKKGLADGQGFFGHAINYRKDGSEFIIQWDIHPLTNEQGEITHWVSYQTDITERENISKKLQEASLEFEDMDEDLKRTLLEIDTAGNIIDSNQSFRETIGYSSEELTQYKLWDLVADVDKKSVHSVCEKAQTAAKNEEAHVWNFKTQEGEQVLLKAIFKTPKPAGGGRIKICFENLSLRNKLIEALKEKALSLEQSMDAANEFTLKFRRDGDKTVCYYASDDVEKITGYSVGELLASGVDIILDKKRADAFHNHLEKGFLGKTTTVECICKKKDGTVLPIIQAFRPVWDKTRAKVEAVKTVAVLEMKESSGSANDFEG